MTTLFLIGYGALSVYLGYQLRQLVEHIQRRIRAIRAVREWEKVRYISTHPDEFKHVEIPKDE